MIEPTVGRVVWVFKREQTSQPEVAFITYVHGDRCINAAGFDANGDPFKLAWLTLLQEGDEPLRAVHATWMPYQKGQAAKTEALEAKLGTPK